MKTISPLPPQPTENRWEAIASYVTPPVSPIPGRTQSALGQAIQNFAASKLKQIKDAVQNFNTNATYKFNFTTPAPSPSPTPIPQPIRIAIPASSGQGETVVPQVQTDAIFQAFDKYGEATNAAQVLHHSMQVSGTPQELAQGRNWWGNIGENPSFNPSAVNVNNGGSTDTGLFQINSDTFNGMMNNPFWRDALARRGITDYEQMKDPFKNALTAMLILMRGNFNAEQGTMNPNPNYYQWFGAPQALRR